MMDEAQRRGFICSATRGLFFYILSSHFGGCTAGPEPTAPSIVWFNAGGREARKEGLEKRIIQQEQNTVQRYGAIRYGRDAVMVILQDHIVQNVSTLPS